MMRTNRRIVVHVPDLLAVVAVVVFLLLLWTGVA